MESDDEPPSVKSMSDVEEDSMTIREALFKRKKRKKHTPDLDLGLEPFEPHDGTFFFSWNIIQS